MHYYMIDIYDLISYYSHGYIAVCDADTMTSCIEFEL